MSVAESYQDLLSKIKPGDFDNRGIPDRMAIWIEDNGKMIKKWVRMQDAMIMG
jgi:hypothetical protein